MFRGVVPLQCMAQILRAVPFGTWPGVYVCCSGTLRFETCLRSRHEKIPIIGNDVSAFSCMLGAVASGAEFPIRFRGRLEFIEEILEGAPFIRRAAALLVASDMAEYRRERAGVGGSKTPHYFALAHFRHYVQNFGQFLREAQAQLESRIQPLGLRGFFNGDWLEHVEHAIAEGFGIVAFPPFFKGDYEAMHRFVHENVTWPAPRYPLYDPKTLPEVVERIASSGVPWCVLSDQTLAREPFLKFVKGRKVPHYCYGTAARSVFSLLHGRCKPAPFRFHSVSPEALGPQTKVVWAPADKYQAAYIKSRFLARDIVYTPAPLEFFIYLDDMLLGLVGYALSTVRYGHRTEVYLLSDVCTTRQAKLSKLVARMALSRELVRQMELRYLQRFRLVVTTARSKGPVSMKYRGIYDLWSRQPTDEGGFILQYRAEVQPFTLAECFDWWRMKYHAAR